MDYIDLFLAFTNGKAKDYEFLHCPFEPDKPITLKVTYGEHNDFHCFSCGKVGRIESLSKIVHNIFKIWAEDLRYGVYQDGWIAKSNGYMPRIPGRPYRKAWKMLDQL